MVSNDAFILIILPLLLSLLGLNTLSLDTIAWFGKMDRFSTHKTMLHSLLHQLTLLIEKATASAADLWDPMHGCLDAWMLVVLPGGRFGTNLGCILDALDYLWCQLGWSLPAFGRMWARLAQPGYPDEPVGAPVRAGAPI